MEKIKNDFIKKLFIKAKENGFTEYEAYYVKGKSFSVNIFKGEIYQYKNSDSQGIGFRGIYNGKMSYSYSEEVSEGVIDVLIENAIINNEILEVEEKEEIFKDFKKVKYNTINSYNEALNNTTVEEKIEIAKEIEKICLEDSRVKSVNSSVVGSSESYLLLANSAGLLKEEVSNLGYAYAYLEMADGADTRVAIDTWLGNDFKDLDVEKLAKSTIKKAEMQLNAKPVKSNNNMNIIFDNNSFIEFVSVFIPSFYGENVQKGFSKLKGKLGEKIGNEKITIKDDGVCEWYTNSSFDSEGYPTSNKILVEKGELKIFLHNLKSAKKDNVSPTGNGYKPSFKSSVVTSHTNFYLEGGNSTLEELIGEMGTGLVVHDLAGLHSGVNTISGDFSLAAKAFYVENGKIIKAVEDITVAGNFFEMLFNCMGVANDLKFDFPEGLGSVGSPSIWFSSLAVAGE
ncbi:MAG: TldD/PmbA family protein [Lachnospirales bacterium]